MRLGSLTASKRTRSSCSSFGTWVSCRATPSCVARSTSVLLFPRRCGPDDGHERARLPGPRDLPAWRVGRLTRPTADHPAPRQGCDRCFHDNSETQPCCSLMADYGTLHWQNDGHAALRGSVCQRVRTLLRLGVSVRSFILRLLVVQRIRRGVRGWHQAGEDGLLWQERPVPGVSPRARRQHMVRVTLDHSSVLVVLMLLSWLTGCWLTRPKPS
jgi:hypothetical protein